MDQMPARPAFAYMRKCVGQNVGEADRRIVNAFAAETHLEISAEYTGDFLDDVIKSCGFASLLRRIEVSGVNTVVIASVQSLGGDPWTQSVAQQKLAAHGIDVLIADGSNFDAQASQTAARIMNLASLLEDALKKAKLRAAADRMRTKFGPKRRRTYAEMCPEVVATAKRVYRERLRNGRPLSLREIGNRLAQSGFVTKNGKHYHPEAIKRMIKGPRSSGTISTLAHNEKPC